ncbi:hypothetical protein [Legionella gresilensis]|uniref:hypothetical protein n=1 Tax=Legionella gresilensis TaxID=91823 RepID=UPI0010412AA4|nr:hypothetical protein [Legionella gresilensis]
MFFKIEKPSHKNTDPMEEEALTADLSYESMEAVDAEGDIKEDEVVAWNSSHGPIRTINFDGSLQSKLEDKFTAYGCITVITNNRVLGTLTHLDTETNIKQFIKCLDKVLDEHKESIETFLIGGNNKAESKKFLQNLRSALKANNYQITQEHTGGSVLIRRYSVLYQDRVIVKIQQSGAEKATLIELFFKQLNNDVSSAKEHALSSTKPF